MPSYDIGKDIVCGWVRRNFPKNSRILDVGACDGKWKRLLPEYAMDAVEAWEPHCENIKSMYGQVFCKDVAKLNYDPYDLIIFGDVIEHMTISDAQKVLKYAFGKCKDMIVAVPYLYPQGEIGGNPWEVHKQPDLTAEIFAERYPELEVLYDTKQNYCFYHKKNSFAALLNDTAKILVAVPTYENIYPDTFKSIYELDKGGHEVDFDFIRGYDVANARNQIGKATLDRGYEWVLMVDNDEVLPKDSLLNLLETQEDEPKKGMTVGWCLSRPRGSANTSGRTTAFKFGGKDYVAKDAYTAKELRELASHGRHKLQIRGTGLGCALIHRKVFEFMKFPWFRWVEYNNGSQLSEDLYFCEKFKEIGLPVFVDTRVSCGHLMRYIDWARQED